MLQALYTSTQNVHDTRFMFHFQVVLVIVNCQQYFTHNVVYEGHLESKERFAIQRYLLTPGKKQNMHVLSHTFTYFST